MSTAPQSTDEMDRLKNRVEEMNLNLARLRKRQAEIAVRLDHIADRVRQGDTSATSEVAALIAEQDAGHSVIRLQERELTDAETELKRLANIAIQSELAVLLSQMEARRARIIELARSLSLELGALQGIDRAKGSKLVPMHVGSLVQMRFVQLLEPIEWDKDPAWAGSHIAVPHGFEHSLRICGFKPL